MSTFLHSKSALKLLRQLSDDPYMDDVLKEFSFKVIDAFQGVVLGDGIGFLEANCIDNYLKSDDPVSVAQRELDERHDWVKAYTWATEQIENGRDFLSEFAFMDAKGLYFHLPILLIGGTGFELEQLFLHLKHSIANATTARDFEYLKFEGMLTEAQKTIILKCWRIDVNDFADRDEWVKRSETPYHCQCCGKEKFDFIPMNQEEIAAEKQARDSYILLDFFSKRWDIDC